MTKCDGGAGGVGPIVLPVAGAGSEAAVEAGDDPPEPQPKTKENSKRLNRRRMNPLTTSKAGLSVRGVDPLDSMFPLER